MSEGPIQPSVHPGIDRLLPVERSDPLSGQVERYTLLTGQPLVGCPPCLLRDLQLTRWGAIDPLRPGAQHGIAPMSNIVQDALYRLNWGNPLTEYTLDAVQHSRRHLLVLPRHAPQDGRLGLAYIDDTQQRHDLPYPARSHSSANRCQRVDQRAHFRTRSR